MTEYRKSNKKIDIHVNGKYKCTTNWAQTCKEAKKRYLELYPQYKNEKVKASFSKN